MTLLLLKLLLGPLFVTLASLAARRWGPRMAGWLAGFPIIAGPVLFFYTWEQGTAFAAHAAGTTLLGIVSLSLFCLTYGRLARRRPWPLCLALAWLAFAASTAVLRGITTPLLMALAAAALALAGALALLKTTTIPLLVAPPPRGDLPLRMVAAALLILTLTGVARTLGPRMSGLITPFPVASTVLVVFTHVQNGGEAAVRVLRGLLIGLFSFALFCALLAARLETWGVGLTFSAALLVSLATQLAVLPLTRRPSRHL